MNTANKELSKKLHALSGWEEPYDLGFLLRKLPDHTTIKKNIDPKLRQANFANARYYRAVLLYVTSASGDTPEDAACKLAISLIEQGVLEV